MRGAGLNFKFLVLWLPLAILLSCSVDINHPYEPDPSDLGKNADRTATKQYAETCAQNVTLGYETSGGEEHWSDGHYGGTTIPMYVKSNGTSLSLSVALTLHYPQGNQSDLRRRVDQTKPCLVDFFAKHGIELDVTFYNEGESGAPSQASSQVDVRLYGSRPSTLNMKNWAFGENGKLFSQGYACTFVIHEFSHLLGLPDEYYDSKVPDRPIGEMDSVMRSLSIRAEQVKLYPRHVKTIFRNICP